jgi:hypothetical protein
MSAEATDESTYLESRGVWNPACTHSKPRYEDISDLSAWWDEVAYLTARLEKGEPVVFEPNTMKVWTRIQGAISSPGSRNMAGEGGVGDERC